LRRAAIEAALGWQYSQQIARPSQQTAVILFQLPNEQAVAARPVPPPPPPGRDTGVLDDIQFASLPKEVVDAVLAALPVKKGEMLTGEVMMRIAREIQSTYENVRVFWSKTGEGKWVLRVALAPGLSNYKEPSQSSGSRPAGPAITEPEVTQPVITQGMPRRITVGGPVQRNRLVQQVPPVYPDLARQARVQGTVTLKVTIGPEGDVTKLDVISGPALLVQSAVEAVRQWRYKPTLLNGNPVEVETRVDVNFTLSDGGPANAAPAGESPAGALAKPVDPGQTAQREVFRVGDGVTEPRLIYKVEPAYTQEARKAGLSGVVVLNLEVGPDGQAGNIRVAHGLGMGLDEKAVEAVRQWRFEPGSKDGVPVSVPVTIQMGFRSL
jgi:TonB family protein